MQIMPDWNGTYNSLARARFELGLAVQMGWNFVGGNTMLIIEYNEPEVVWHRGVHLYVWNGRNHYTEMQAALELPVHRID